MARATKADMLMTRRREEGKCPSVYTQHDKAQCAGKRTVVTSGQRELVIDDGLRRVVLGVRLRMLLLRWVHLIVHHLLGHVHIRWVAVLLGVVVVRLRVRRIPNIRVHGRRVRMTHWRLRRELLRWGTILRRSTLLCEERWLSCLR